MAAIEGDGKGGGPLLVPGFKELYLALKAEGMVLTLNTNGTLLDEPWADFFARHKPRRVNITLYGADDAAYETLCRCPGGFEKALAAVRLLRARGVDVKLNGSVTPENVGEMDRLYAIARQLDVPMHMDAYMMPGGAGGYGAYETYSRYGQASLGEVGRRDKDGRIIRE